MKKVPDDIRIRFDRLLVHNAVPVKYRPYYHKWLRYYLDFCQKYHHPPNDTSSRSKFLKKLVEKGQSDVYQRQASHAVAIYYQIVANQPNASIDKNHLDQRERSPSSSKGEPKHAGGKASNTPLAKTKRNQHIPPTPFSRSETLARSNKVRGNNTAEYKPSENESAWNIAKTNLANEIKVRHYSKNTLQTYCGWLTKFQAHAKNKNPIELTDEDFKNFLTFLAVN